MILVDTSVWIDYFNGVTNPHTDLLDASIVQGSVAIGDLIFLEILQGIRNDKQYRQTKQSLMALDQYEMFGKDMANMMAVYQHTNHNHNDKFIAGEKNN